MDGQTPSPHCAPAGRTHVAEPPDLRVPLMPLAPGKATPWHRHSNVADTACRLVGAVEVQAKGPDESLRLAPGEPCRMAPGRVHRVANAGEVPCRFLLVQGVGAYDFLKAQG